MQLDEQHTTYEHAANCAPFLMIKSRSPMVMTWYLTNILSQKQNKARTANNEHWYDMT